MSNEFSEAKAKIKKKVKSHLPKDWITELRISYRIFMETWYGIKRAGWINVVIISTMAAILLIFGAMCSSAISATSFTKQLGNVLEISVYLKNGTDIDNAQKKLGELEHVLHTKLKTKEEAWAQMQKEMVVTDMSNPLPDTIHLKIDKPVNIPTVYSEAKQFDFVDDLSYSKDIAERLQMLNNIIQMAMLVVIFVVIGLTIAIINNTIHLVIESRKDEIEIMRLMGVSNWYIKIPLVMQGAFYGFAGALLALIPMNIVEVWLTNIHTFFKVAQSPIAVNIVSFSMFVIAIGCSAGGSVMSIKKHLKV
ncbi:permease-like cell division protein FtsX [bacterium]|nr:permease-like cell division protein FtsX [bacterium]